MGRSKTVNRHLSEQEIKILYKSSPKHKDKLKILALLNLYNGKTISATAEYLMMSYSNLKSFLKKWNAEGIGSLNITHNIDEKISDNKTF